MTSSAARIPRRARLKRLEPLDALTHDQIIHGITNERGPLDFVDHDEPVGDERARIRKPEPRYSRDPEKWIGDSHMTKTEVSLRLANYLLAKKLVSTEVSVALTGLELTRREKPKFPVLRYLKERGFRRRIVDDDWRGTYTMEGVGQVLRLHAEPEGADLVTTLTNGRRLVGFVQRGLISPTRSPAEHKLLRMAIGKAVTSCDTTPDDVVAAVLPRSERFRQLANSCRSAPGMIRAGTLVLLVDRAGEVDGFPEN